MIGLPELLVILVILLVLFGATRLPKLARAIAESRRELAEPRAEPTETPD